MSERVVNLRDFPVRIALGPSGKFTRGRHLPPDMVRIDRRTRWGNPFTVKESGRDLAIALYREWVGVNPTFLEPLRGKRLACWCAPLPCHGDVIAELIP